MSDGIAEILTIAGVFMLVTALLSAFALISNTICSESIKPIDDMTPQGCSPANTSEVVQINGVTYLHCTCAK